MRILILVTGLIFSQLYVRAQSDRVSLRVTDASLESILQELVQQTGYKIRRNTEQSLANGIPMTLHIRNVTLPEALDVVFKNQPFQYTLENRTIVVADKPLPPTANANTNTVKGRVTDEAGKPVEAVTIESKLSGKKTVTDANGEFTIPVMNEQDFLLISHVSYEKRVEKAKMRRTMDIQLFPSSLALEQVVISTYVPTGHQKIAEHKMTGSFAYVDSQQFNRRISTHFIDRLENMSTGVLFSKNQGAGSIAGQEVVIRGISTIYGSQRPLIVIDNFPYDGDINNINPNDIESVTILKDAVATGLWGAFAGNGVIVLNTKKGQLDQAPRVSLVSNVMISNKPNLHYLPLMSSSDYMEVTKFLYENGFYTSRINTPYALVPPDVMILDSVEKNLLSPAAAEVQLDRMRANDLRSDLEKYFYRKSVNQQYALNISGGGNKMKYYFSAGYDKNLPNLDRNYYERMTLNANNVYLLLKDKLELTAGVGFTQSNTANNNSGSVFNNIPYFELVDETGNAAVVPVDYRQEFKNTAAGGLLDWNFRPLEELQQANNLTRLTDYRVNIGVDYKILPGLNFTVKYQYGKGTSDQENFRSQSTYFTRNLINKYSQQDANGLVTHYIPLGGIMDFNSFDYTSHNARVQVDYTKTWKAIHNFSVTGGIERRSLKTQSKARREYGYDPVTQQGLPVDYAASYPLFATPFIIDRIPNNSFTLGTIDNYLSYYTNFLYTFKYRYNLSVNLRKDESNLFGNSINRRGTPLWSVGAGWLISREKFFHAGWLSELRLRATHGYSGNIDKTISPYTVVRFPNNLNSYNVMQAYVANPANRHLQWEKVRITNFALDFSSYKSRISGTLEYYIKNSTDLIGIQPVDQTTGVSSYKGNTADMRGKGLDFTLSMHFIDQKKWKWYGTVLFSYVSNEVTGYDDTGKAVNAYVTQIEENPVNGTPLGSIYAYDWAGLNPLNGNPRGYLNKEITEDYSAIFNSKDISNMIYVGPATPKYFGSYRNTISYKNFNFSFLVQYKLGYFFRRPSINYYFLFGEQYPGHTDYTRRWQKPGDELITNVPSMVYPRDQERDNLYTYSKILVEKADHIRLQDIQLDYTIRRKDVKRLPFQSISLNVYISNIGVLWKATNSALDPEYLKDLYRTPLTVAFGLQVNF